MGEYTQNFNVGHEKEERRGTHEVSEDKTLELRLGLPEDIPGYQTTPATTHGAKRVIQETTEAKPRERSLRADTKEKVYSFPWLNGSLHSPALQREAQKEFLQPQHSYPLRSGVEELHCSDKKPCSTPAAPGNNTPHKRAALAPVVGWPPVRSFRRNISSGSTTKMASDLPNKTHNEGRSFKSDLFVKINMEGVPIGRKINLNAYDSYEKLSVAIDELFRDLLAAQRETPTSEKGNNMDETITKERLVAGSGEYTLIYEDSDGDRILVGDVPWHMFVSTAKRLRVLKSSSLSTPRRAFTFSH
ncbi:hypothetical protein Tsubulata_020514 [Turnera subulata]|uniref:Auxin-responsive protein n=1 Tax=Turnera subulata TaxID=218843 RepID=A0A9Q0F2L9_9ROSI|nr:hypothetical protein Tsubulata_020514 [Turnera subulata]